MTVITEKEIQEVVKLLAEKAAKSKNNSLPITVGIETGVNGTEPVSSILQLKPAKKKKANGEERETSIKFSKEIKAMVNGKEEVMMNFGLELKKYSFMLNGKEEFIDIPVLPDNVGILDILDMIKMLTRSVNALRDFSLIYQATDKNMVKESKLFPPTGVFLADVLTKFQGGSVPGAVGTVLAKKAKDELGENGNPLTHAKYMESQEIRSRQAVCHVLFKTLMEASCEGIDLSKKVIKEVEKNTDVTSYSVPTTSAEPVVVNRTEPSMSAVEENKSKDEKARLGIIL